MALHTNELNFMEDLKVYFKKELANLENNKSKEQLASEIKSLFEKNHIADGESRLVVEMLENSGISISSQSHSKEIANKLYNTKQKKMGAQKDPAEKDEDKQHNSNHRGFWFFISDIKDYSDAQLKDFLRGKFLTHGWTEEELNKICKKGDINYEDTAIPKSNLDPNIEGLTFLDAYVEITKLLIKIHFQNKDKDQVLKDPDDNLKNIARKWTDKQNQQEGSAPELDNSLDNDLQDMSDDFELDPSIQEESEQNSKSEVDDDALTEEDIEIRDKYGVDVSKHSEMVEFLQSEEWEQIQQMQTNALSKSDSIPN